MLEIKDLTFSYSSRSQKVLDGVSLTLGDGETGILLGKNGAGKTTLFKAVLGIVKPTSGSITMNGRELSRLNRRERAGLIAYVPQDVRFGDLSVYDTVLSGRMAKFGLRAGADDHNKTRAILEEMGLEELASRSAQALSGGESRKVAIARALAQEPALLVFDEPTGNLDIANEQLIIEEMKKLSRERGMSILTSLHDLNQAAEAGDRFFFMKNGKIRFSGGKDSFSESVIEEIYDAKVGILDINGKKIIVNGGIV